MDVTRIVEWYETHRKLVAAVVAGVIATVAVVADKEFSLNDAFVVLAALGIGPAGVERAKNDSKVEAKAKRVARKAKGE